EFWLFPRRDDARSHGRASRRLVRQGQHVEIAVQGLGQGARDWRGGVGEEVCVGSLSSKGGALLRPVSVLLVHEDVAQFAEAQAGGCQRVRADDEAEAAGGQPLLDAAPLRRGGFPRQQRRLETRGAKEGREGAEMLRRED